jgi:uncharacterized membrane protein
MLSNQTSDAGRTSANVAAVVAKAWWRPASVRLLLNGFASARALRPGTWRAGPFHLESRGAPSGKDRIPCEDQMESRAKFLGHPIHQTLVAFPVGLLVMTTVFDIVHAVGESTTSATVAFWLLGAGILAGLIAAPFGTLDWLAIPKGVRAKRIGAIHGVGNVVVLLLYATSWWLRSDQPADPPVAALVLSIVAVAIAGVTAWLGGELVSRLGVGVADNASLDAPSSLGASRVHRPDVPVRQTPR